MSTESGILVGTLCKKIEDTYNKILNYSGSSSSGKMASFDLKSASSLIPVMDGKEKNHRKHDTRYRNV